MRNSLQRRKAKGGRGCRDGRLISAVIEKRELGYSFSDIARDVGRSRERIGQIWRRHEREAAAALCAEGGK